MDPYVVAIFETYCIWFGVISRVCVCPLNFLFCYSELLCDQVRVSLYPQLVTIPSVKCPCLSSKSCTNHKIKNCPDLNCLHLLSLQECLSSNTVWCQYYKVDTSFIKKYFPVETEWLCEEEVTEPLHQFSSPSWMRGASKLLDINQEGSDWRALAQYLGYNAYKVEQFEMSLQPSVMMMNDWMTTSKNTSLSLEMVISGLEHLGRHDVVSVIREGSHELDYPSVFISYQWDSQTEVIRIRQYLEEHKISCWMDIGQMGGGDSLYQKVYQAINNCRVVLCCLSPKFVISDWCVKEVLLADLLKKPILPVMVSRTQWPPLE